MAAPKGNQFWKARTKHGRDKIFKSAGLLWEACCEYFEWVEANPLWEVKVTQYQGEVIEMPVAKMRAMTKGAMCLFLDIDQTTWNRWRDGNDDDFCRVTRVVEEVIYAQKFAGAAAELFNANIIARDLGLKDANSHEHSGPNGGPIQLSDTERAARLSAILEAVKSRSADGTESE